MYLSHIRKDQREKLNRKIKAKYNKANGCSDILPQNTYYNHLMKIKEAVMYVCDQVGCMWVTTPIIEPLSMYKKIFEQNDEFLSKLVYVSDTKDNQMVLKPEMTISIARAHIEAGLHLDNELREYCYYEKLIHRDNKRFREFYQFGIEIYREQDSAVEADLIITATHFFNLLKLNNIYQVHINNVGNNDARNKWAKDIKAYFKDKVKRIPNDIRKIIDKDPIKLLNVDDEDIQLHLLNAPKLIEYISDEDKKNYNNLKDYLNAVGISYVENYTLIGNFPYYNGNLFEFKILNSKDKVCGYFGGGGRYNNLVESLGGEPVCAAGFYIELDKIEEKVKELNLQIPKLKNTEVFIAHLGPNARKYAMKLTKEFREIGIGVKENLGTSSLRTQLKEAEKMRSKYMILIGEKELDNGEAIIRDLELSDQQKIPLDQIHNIIKNYLNKSDIKLFLLDQQE